MPDIFSTDVVNGFVASLKRPVNGLTARYFATMTQDAAEEIHFDVEVKGRRVAPFVSPLLEGKIVASNTYQAKTFKPAYIKDKRVFDANRPFKRAMGEQIGGSLSPMDRMRALLANDLQDQIEMLDRRKEIMASEAIRTGKVTVVGDGYPTTVVDFGRDAALTPTALASTARWGQSAEDPLGNLQTWSDLVLKKEGTAPIDVIMGTDAWSAFRKNADVKSRLDVRRVVGNEMSMNAITEEGLVFKGTLDGFNIFVYSGWYVDPADGTEKVIWPADIVAMTTPAIEGVQAHGAIRDEEAGFQALPYFAKSWTTPDPAVRYLMMQSAPLMVPYRVNASLAVDVL